MICANCGHKLPEGSRFCEKCGTPVGVMGPKTEAKKPGKSLIWVIIVVLIILGCCCVAVIGGGFFYFRNQGQSWQDVFPDVLKELPGTTEVLPEPEIDSPIPEEATQPTSPDETIQEPGYLPEDYTLAVTGSGIWMVNEQTQNVTQISHAQLDAPWDLKAGMSPDKKFFAFITGVGGASVNPMLLVLDMDNQTSILQLELTGPIIQPGMEGTHGDPAFEAIGAIQYDNSLAWSPDGTRLAFIAARDGDSADVYLFNRSDQSITRLTDEDGHAADLHWSPDGQLLQYVSVNTFGTGAGSNMESLWSYDFKSNTPLLLQELESSGENFLTWTDNSHFLISSWSGLCESYHLRLVNADRLLNQTIVEGSFTGSAYDPEQKTGFFSVTEFNTEFNYDNCPYGDEPMDAGVYIFGEGIGIPIVGEIGIKKFEQLNAYGVGFIPQGNLFTVYSDDGLQYIYQKNKYGYNSLEILPEVKGFVPYPSPTGDYWAWASRNKTGLWITEDNSHPVELSANFSGVPLWNQDGKLIYFYENDQLFSASAPKYNVNLIGEFRGEEILGVIK